MTDVDVEVGTAPLGGTMVVVDLSEGIAGGYCTKLLADAGALVIKVEAPTGDPLRRRSASGRPVHADYGGPLFQYLSGSKHSVVADVDDPEGIQFVLGLVAGADVVVWSSDSWICRHEALAPRRLADEHPALIIAALTPFGLGSPWQMRSANGFTIEAMSGGSWARGWHERPPVMCGGELGSFALGTFAALGILIARHRAYRTGSGDLVDCSALDVMHLTFSFYGVTYFDLAGRPYRIHRRNNIPGVHRTRDGYVGIWVTTGQQWQDFCVMVGQPEWLADESLGSFDNRALREDELIPAIDQWCRERTTAEVLALAELLRVPCAPAANGATLPTLEHFAECLFFTENAATGLTQPDVWYTLGAGAERRPPDAPPRLGEHTSLYRTPPRPQAELPPSSEDEGDALPLSDLRIADFTGFMAGPIIGHCFAMFGADVLHIESPKRPDGIRAAAIRPLTEDQWWETSPYFLSLNTNKRDIAIDLTDESGKAAARRMVAECDIVIDNYSPRVMPQLGFDYPTVKALRSDMIMLRAPGFGTTGPWANRVAYAPTVDAAGGAAWVTGFPDRQPLTNNSASDALGGLHAAIALLLAVEYRRRSGLGMLLESPQVGPVLSMTGEQVVEYAATGVILERVGNRSWVRAPQGIYPVEDVDRGNELPRDDWVAISVEDDEQWVRFAHLIGGDLLTPELAVEAARLADQDRIDAAIIAWTSKRNGVDVVEQLQAIGVPAAQVVLPHLIAEEEPVRARNFYEYVYHDVAGATRLMGFPAKLRSMDGPWHRTPAPHLGEHNRDILEGIAGLTPDEVTQLERRGVIGQTAERYTGW